MKNNNVKTYRSKVSKVLVAFAFLVFYGPLVFFINDIQSKEGLLFLVLLTLVFFFVLYIFLGTIYTT